MTNTPTPFDGMCKIRLFGSRPEDTETLWAFELGDGRYRLDNLPWFAYRVSVGDVIGAYLGEDGILVMTEVLEKSGNRTVRVIGETDETNGHWTARFATLMQKLQELGCGYEGANPRYLAVNVPAGVDLEQVGALLDKAAVQFEYADPPHDDLYPKADGQASSDE